MKCPVWSGWYFVAYGDFWVLFAEATRVIYQQSGGDGGSSGCEIGLEGPGPWPVGTTGEINVLHTPGPTPQSVSILVDLPHGESILFTGRTAGYNPEFQRVDGHCDHTGTRTVSVDEHAHSLRRLANKAFLWLASGLGQVHRFNDAAERAIAMLDGADAME